MPGHKIFVTTDASDTGSGTLLAFGPTYETARPVAYDSRAFKGAELNYPVHEKELLAIIQALAKWRTDLLGYTFQVSVCCPNWDGTQHSFTVHSETGIGSKSIRTGEALGLTASSRSLTDWARTSASSPPKRA